MKYLKKSISRSDIIILLCQAKNFFTGSGLEIQVILGKRSTNSYIKKLDIKKEILQFNLFS